MIKEFKAFQGFSRLWKFKHCPGLEFCKYNSSTFKVFKAPYEPFKVLTVGNSVSLE